MINLSKYDELTENIGLNKGTPDHEGHKQSKCLKYEG